MKNLLFILVLLFTLHSFAQQDSYSNPVADSFIIKSIDCNGPENAIAIPEGKFMIVVYADGLWKYSTQDHYNNFGNELDAVGSSTRNFLPSGSLLWSNSQDNYSHIILTVHNYIFTYPS